MNGQRQSEETIYSQLILRYHVKNKEVNTESCLTTYNDSSKLSLSLSDINKTQSHSVPKLAK